jgi:hypothetical protein
MPGGGSVTSSGLPSEVVKVEREAMNDLESTPTEPARQRNTHRNAADLASLGYRDTTVAPVLIDYDRFEDVADPIIATEQRRRNNPIGFASKAAVEHAQRKPKSLTSLPRQPISRMAARSAGGPRP